MLHLQRSAAYSNDVRQLIVTKQQLDFVGRVGQTGVLDDLHGVLLSCLSVYASMACRCLAASERFLQVVLVLERRELHADDRPQASLDVVRVGRIVLTRVDQLRRDVAEAVERVVSVGTRRDSRRV